MAYYLFILNDINYYNINYSAEYILDVLITKKKWIFTSSQYNQIKKFSTGDSVIIYLAGRKRKFFIGHFIIKSSAKELFEQHELFKMFDYYIEIKHFKYFKEKILIKNLVYNLNFIKNKKNYGLHLRKNILQIFEHDFLYIQNNNTLNLSKKLCK